MNTHYGTNKTIREPAKETPFVDEFDVLICGAGTAGVPAAIAAARTGARVGLVERYGFLGGVPAYCIMPAWHGLARQNSGMISEFAQRVNKFRPDPNPLENRHMEPEIVKQVAANMVEEAGVDIHLHTVIADTIVDARAMQWPNWCGKTFPALKTASFWRPPHKSESARHVVSKAIIF
ncbi:MAG: FAD-dependent oxidoreductase [Armatimonadota bacterium]